MENNYDVASQVNEVILEEGKKIINQSSMSEEEKASRIKALIDCTQRFKERKINVLITGGTGCGKSSTINALFGEKIAEVNYIRPETMEIENYEIGNNLIIWDSPGLGDGTEEDKRHASKLISKLHEKNSQGEMVIDLVLVIIDGSNRDMGTAFELINKVIIPNLEDKNRIIVAINKADNAMSGVGWNNETNKPDENLLNFLDDKVLSVKKRIKESTNVDVDPIYYSAGMSVPEYGINKKPYNVAKLMYYIMEKTPVKKRMIIGGALNNDGDVWSNNDNEDYDEKIGETIWETIEDTVDTVSEICGELGSAIGMEQIGRAVGTVVGGALGVARGVGKGLIKGAKKLGKKLGDFFNSL
jgi:hypothetical protein